MAKRTNYSLSALIEALQIIRKYGDVEYPTNCTHDELHVKCEAKVTDEDLARLSALGFNATEGGFQSFRFGSC